MLAQGPAQAQTEGEILAATREAAAGVQAARIHRSRIGLALDDADQRIAVELGEQLETFGLEHLQGPSQAPEVHQTLQAFEEDVKVERRRAGADPDGPVRRPDAA